MPNAAPSVPPFSVKRAMSSRHNHFPGTDAARRLAIRRAVTDLDTAWSIADAAPDGLIFAIDTLADAPADLAIVGLLPWLTNIYWLRTRLDAALALLTADYFARPPLRPLGGGEGGTGGLILADRGAIRLTLHLRPFAANAPAPAAMAFVPGRAALYIVDCGGAELCMHEVTVSAAEEAGAFTASAAASCRSLPPRWLQTGETLHLDTARQGFTFAGGARDLLFLELTVRPPSPLPMRAYDIASGKLIHVSASRRDSSFRQIALTLLRHLGRADAAPFFVAETRSEDFAARWNAMRELVALDPATARAPLERMAATDPHSEVRRAAAATLALFSLPSCETGREGGGRPGPCTSPEPCTLISAPRASGAAPCPA